MIRAQGSIQKIGDNNYSGSASILIVESGSGVLRLESYESPGVGTVVMDIYGESGNALARVQPKASSGSMNHYFTISDANQLWSKVVWLDTSKSPATQQVAQALLQSVTMAGTIPEKIR